MNEVQSATDLPVSPEDDRRRRMIQYSIMMGIRMACFVLVIVLPGWWKLLAVPGAVFLPFFAVVLANAVGSTSTRAERPEVKAIEQGPTT